jgi:hypothetical protein
MIGDKLEIIEVQGEKFQALESNGTCTGCVHEDNWELPHCSTRTPCQHNRRADGKEVIWVKVQHGKDLKDCTIREAKLKIKVLQQKIQDLIQEFEDETATRVDKVNLSHYQQIGSSSGAYSVEVSVVLD